MQVFLDRYVPVHANDRTFGSRLHGYLAVFPLFWLGQGLREGLTRAANGMLTGWNINGLPANERLRRLLARCEAWPNGNLSRLLTSLEDAAFF